MNLTLTLSERESAELERCAAAAGTDVRTYLLHNVNDPGTTEDPSSNDLPYELWKRAFQQWLQGHQTRNVNLDDSRECIYE